MSLQKYMKDNHITQRKISADLGITISHLRMILLGKGFPSRKLCILIEKVTNGKITKEEMMFGKGKSNEK